MPLISYIKVNSGNVYALSKLRVSKSQWDLIEPNPYWLAEVLTDSEYLSFGIYTDKTPAGLITVIDPRTIEEEGGNDDDQLQPDCLYLYRLMIDERHQGKKLGLSAIKFSQQLASILGLQGVSLTTMDQAPGNALNLYLASGFMPTGRRINNETELVWEAGDQVNTS